MTASTVYLVFHNRPDTLAFCGVFTTPQIAEEECLTEDHWVGPIELNKPFHHQQPIDWEGAYFPRRGEQPDAANPR